MCRTPDTEAPPRAASALLLARPALRISASPHRHGDARLGITTTTPLTCWITSWVGGGGMGGFGLWKCFEQPGVESDSGSEASVGVPAPLLVCRPWGPRETSQPFSALVWGEARASWVGCREDRMGEVMKACLLRCLVGRRHRHGRLFFPSGTL